MNQYANEIKPHIKDVLYNVLVDPEYEQEGDRLIYLDMVSPSPKLELLTEKVLEISGKFEEYLNEFPEADILHDILEELGQFILSKIRTCYLGIGCICISISR